MCGENALKEVIGKVLEKVQVGVVQDWEACKKQSVSGGGWLCMYLHIGYPSKPTIFSTVLEGRFNTISIP
jgi:hypothetical protein